MGSHDQTIQEWADHYQSLYGDVLECELCRRSYRVAEVVDYLGKNHCIDCVRFTFDTHEPCPIKSGLRRNASLYELMSTQCRQCDEAMEILEDLARYCVDKYGV